MGKEVVRQQNKKEPGKRTRLMDRKDVLHVLDNNSGTNSVESILLEIDYPERQFIKVDALKTMNNLRFIKMRTEGCFYSSAIDDESLSFKHLKYLEWIYSPWKSINNIDMPNVVVIVLRYNKLKVMWEGFKNLKKLRILDVSYSKSLTMTGSFIGLENLEELNLYDCPNLKEVDSSIICLEKLHTLNFSNCINIKSIPNLPPNIKLILGGDCTNLVNLPSNMSELQSLSALGLHDCLNLRSEGLMRVTGLKKLQHLNLMRSNLSQVSIEIGNLESLQKLYLCDNKFSSLPDSVSNLSQLDHLDISGCHELRSLPLLPSKLTWINATDCPSLDVMPFDSMRKANVFRSKLFEESFFPKPLCISLSWKKVPEIFQYKGDGGQVLSFVAPKKKIYGVIIYASHQDKQKSGFMALALHNRTKETSYQFKNTVLDFYYTQVIICLLNETTLVVETGDTVEVTCHKKLTYGFSLICEGNVVDSTLAIRNTVNVNHENTSPCLILDE